MLIILGILLAIGWILGFTVMKVSSVGIHVLLLLALVSVVFHFFRGRAKSS